MNIADIILLVFVLAMVLFGIKNGFIKMLIDLLSGFMAFIFAVIFARPIATSIQDLFIFDGMKNSIQEFFTHNADLASKNVTQTIDGFPLPEFLKTLLLKDFPNPTQTINDGAKILSERVFHLMLLGIICIALFILIRVGFYFIDIVIEKFLDKIKVLDFVNKILGGVLGIANALLIIYIILALITITASSIPSISNLILSSAIASKLYLNNLLLMILV